MAKQEKQNKALIIIGISLLSIFLAYILSLTDTFEMLELKLLDMRFELRGSIEVEKNPIVIVQIDDQSDEATEHRWPWPRSYFAEVIENLNEAGAAVIGVDVIFDQPDKYGLQYDDEFAETLQQYDNVVLAGKLLRTTGRSQYSTLYPPYQKFAENSDWGLVAIEADIDGFYRRYLVAESHNDSLYASFSSEVLRKYLGEDSLIIENNPETFKLNDLTIPKYDGYSMLINFSGPAFNFPYYSFANILDDDDFDIKFDYDMDVFSDTGDVALGIPPGLKYTGDLKNKIVLIGATMQELHDNFPTPFLDKKNPDGSTARVEMPGVEIHANALLTMLNQNFLMKAPWWLTLLTVLIGTFLAYLITHLFRTFWSIVLTTVAIIIFIIISIFAFTELNMLLQIVFPVFANAFAYVGHTLYHYLETQKEKRMLRGAFTHYVPEKVVEQIVQNPDSLKLGGEERIITVIFSDVAGFTSISEKLTPRQLVTLLNEYLTEMTEIILDHNGIIDKYEGDAIMAEFGMPVSTDDHPQVACRASLKMQRRLEELRTKWKKEGKPELSARVGINTGEVIAGNMGSKTVFDYTVLGDHVNLGSRLEGANKFYGTNIMISEFTYAYVKDDFHTRPLDLIRVKGKEKPIEVFELIAERSDKLDSKFSEMLNAYKKGMVSYRQRDWKTAIEYFSMALELKPDDFVSKIYRKRCLEYKINEPAADWDGVTTMTEK